MAGDIQLTTTHLVLRPMRLENSDTWAALLSSADATSFRGRLKFRLGVTDLFRQVCGDESFEKSPCFSIFERPCIHWVGYAGISWPERVSLPELIISFIRDRRRYGYDYEASSAVLSWAFETLRIPEVISCIAPDDAMSQRTARQLGSVDRGAARFPTSVPGDELLVDMVSFSRDRWLTQSHMDSPDFFAPRC